MLEEDLGEDFVDFLGYNPLSASIDLYLKAAFADEDQILNRINLKEHFPCISLTCGLKT